MGIREEFERKKSKIKQKNECGSVTLFVLIAMIFFLIIGLSIFMSNMNNSVSQERDIKKIQKEYDRDSGKLDEIYDNEEKKQSGKLLISVTDKSGEIYQTNTWVNTNSDKLPISIDITWPNGINERDKELKIKGTINGQTVNITINQNNNSSNIPNYLEINGDHYVLKESVTNCEITVIAKAKDKEANVTIKVDNTVPRITINPNGGEYWLDDGENTIELNATITANDIGSGVERVYYKWDTDSTNGNTEYSEENQASSTNAETKTEVGEGTYYLHTKIIDNAGNITETVSEPYIVKKANYKIIKGGAPKFAQTLVEANGKAEDGSTIKVLRGYLENDATNSYTEQTTATLSNNVTFDTNGKTMRTENTITIAEGKTVTFVDSADVKGSLESIDNILITNNGTVIVDSATLNSVDRVIDGGTVTLNSGYIHMTGAKNLTSDYAGIYASNVTVTGGEINSDLHYGIIGHNTVNVTGGIIKGKTYGITGNPGNESSVINISGDSQVIGENNYGIVLWGTNIACTVEGGQISGGIHGIHIYNNTDTVTVTGGTVIGGIDGINARTSTTGDTITIGNSEDALNKTAPVIKGETKYAIEIESSTSTFNFYDGILIGINHDEEYSGRDVTFCVQDDTEVNILTGHKPYTRQNSETQQFETVLEKQVTVTFEKNAEDATLTETSRNVLTNVEYKEKADTAEIVSLPIPTKTGYTFKGWNGKNLFDIDDFMATYAPYQVNEPQKVNFEGEEVWKINGYVSEEGRELQYMKGKFKANTQYTITSEVYDVKVNGHGGIVLMVYYTDGTFEYATGVLEDSQWVKRTVTTNASKTIDHIHVTYATGNAYTYIRGIQIEEGTTATTYEPYYVTDNTIVTQDQK